MTVPPFMGGPRMIFKGGPFDGRCSDMKHRDGIVPYDVRFTLAETGEELHYRREKPIEGGHIFRYQGSRPTRE